MKSSEDATGAAWPPLMRALSLSMGAAIALGLARFSYALLLPPMKADLGWSYSEAGALNTANAVGYLAGALLFPWMARRVSVAHLFIAGCALASVAMAVAGYSFDFHLLLAQRVACGLCSAFAFVGGGLLASRLATAHPRQAGLVLGLYYSGVGWGVVLSALIVPASLGAAAHGWQNAWIALAILCAICAALSAPAALDEPRAAEAAKAEAAATGSPAPLWRAAPLLAAYGLFGMGYIGYMTFVIALLRAADMGATAITAFYITLGLACAASGKVWARVLHRARGGGALSLFCLLLGAATLAPALTGSVAVAFGSGIVFGGTFPAVVSATTAFVRHNLPPSRWAFGISAFTIVFAGGQIVGPVAMGRISDGSSLSTGFFYSAIVLLISAALAILQKPLAAQA